MTEGKPYAKSGVLLSLIAMLMFIAAMIVEIQTGRDVITTGEAVIFFMLAAIYTRL